MPLFILVPMVVIGVSVMILLIWLIRPTKAFAIESPEQAMSVWNHFNYENQASKAQVNDAGSHAIVTTDKGVGLVWSFGTDPLTRLFRKKAEVRADDLGLHIKTGDFSAPNLHIPLVDPKQRTEWAAMIERKR